MVGGTSMRLRSLRRKIKVILVNNFASKYKDQDQELVMQVFDSIAGEITREFEKFFEKFNLKK